MGINGGRNRFGEGESGFERFNITLPPSLAERLEKYRKESERPRSWCIQKAVDEWLRKQGY